MFIPYNILTPLLLNVGKKQEEISQFILPPAFSSFNPDFY